MDIVLKQIHKAIFGKWKKAGIKWKIFAYFLLFSLLLLSFLWVYQTVLLEYFYKSIKISELRQCVNEVERNIDSNDLTSILNELAEKKDVGIMVTDYNFSKINVAGNSEFSIIPRLRVSEFFQIYKLAEENKGEAFQSYRIGGFPIHIGQQQTSPDNNNNNNNNNRVDAGATKKDWSHGVPTAPERREGASQDLLYAKLIQLSDGTKTIIMADVIVTPLDTTVKTLRLQLIQISLIMFFVALMLAFWVAKVISKPIVKTNKYAKLLAAGHYDTQFDGNGYREIIQLNDTLNLAASELAKVEKLRQELIANVSHDLRTPLTMIIGYGEIMRDIPSENTPENVQVVIDEAKRLTTLVNALLDLSKLQSGISELTIEPCNLTETVEEIVARYRKMTENEGFSIEFIHSDEITVNCDCTKITQVLYNLINNAIHYTGEDKSVTVRQILRPESIRIEVTDTGEGISKEHLPYIWDRYFKVDKTHKRSVVGTGLGLSIVKSILELHHATFGVESVIGSGSTFWFELPTQ